jgi:hypothetical protein
MNNLKIVILFQIKFNIYVSVDVHLKKKIYYLKKIK